MSFETWFTTISYLAVILTFIGIYLCWRSQAEKIGIMILCVSILLSLGVRIIKLSRQPENVCSFIQEISVIQHKEETLKDWLQSRTSIVDGKIIVNYTNDDGAMITLSFDETEFAKFAEVVQAIAQ